jgi:hypothetical protein
VSIDRHVYLGPYVRCEVERIDELRPARGCPNQMCQGHGRGGAYAFCPTCGSQIGTTQVRVQGQRINAPLFAECELDQQLYATDLGAQWEDAVQFVYFLPNVRRPAEPTRHLHLVEGYDKEIEIGDTAVSPAGEISWFEAAFAPALAKLRAAYGPARVKVTWGLLHWSS